MRVRDMTTLTLSATMYLDDFSRARYTLPNLPRPSGLPMSKSTSDQRLDGCMDAATANGRSAM